MRRDDDVLVRVHGSWNGWRSAEVRLADLEDVHWSQPPGAPHALLHALLWCPRLGSADLPHRCDRSTAHQLLVCVLKHHTIATTYAELARRANQRNVAASVPPRAAAKTGAALDLRG